MNLTLQHQFGYSDILKGIAEILKWDLDGDDELSDTSIEKAYLLFDKLPFVLNKILLKLPNNIFELIRL